MLNFVTNRQSKSNPIYKLHLLTDIRSYRFSTTALTQISESSNIKNYKELQIIQAKEIIKIFNKCKRDKQILDEKLDTEIVLIARIFKKLAVHLFRNPEQLQLRPPPYTG